MTTQHILISGKVQGVGFRMFTLERARVDNLLGWVRNLKDGRVEALVQGSDQVLACFAEHLKKGPNAFSEVTELVVQEVLLEESLGQFEVVSDGEEIWLKK